jgi:hypothetical protein
MVAMLEELQQIEQDLVGRVRPSTLVPEPPPTAGHRPPDLSPRPPAMAAGSATRAPAPSVAPQAPPALATSAPARRSRAPLVIGLIVLLLGGGAGAFYALHKPGSTDPGAGTVPPPAPQPPKLGQTAATPEPQKPQPPTPQPQPTLQPTAPKMVTVLLDSVPPGAAIIVDGRRISDTPEEIDVPEGTQVHVSLHRDGYRDTEVTLDPAHGRKQVVRLEHARAGDQHLHGPMPPTAARPKRAGHRRVAVEPEKGPVAGGEPPAAEPPPAERAPEPQRPTTPTIVPPRPLTQPDVPPWQRQRRRDPYERLDKPNELKDPYR